MIRFLDDVEIEVTGELDPKTDTMIPHMESFKKGETADGEIAEESSNETNATLEFGDGTIAYYVPRKCFEII
jgi:hypothetical protein